MQAADNLIKEFCQSIGMSQIGLDEENQRSLSFDEKMIVSFIGESGDKLTALAYIGDIGKDADMRVFLEQNFLPDAHGGARFSLEPRSNRIVMSTKWDATRIDLPTFSKDVEGFVNSGMRAQEFLAGGGAGSMAAGAPEGAPSTEPSAPSSTPSSLEAYQNML